MRITLFKPIVFPVTRILVFLDANLLIVLENSQFLIRKSSINQLIN